ncbi:hypothetical protein OHR68_40650 [Spirillospora sp. NBC_00431]
MGVVVGTVGYVWLGLVCIVVGVRTRRGIGRYMISRRVKVSYEELPLRERVRASNSLFAMGAAFLLCATFSLVPEPVMMLFFLIALLLFVFYVVTQRWLRRAAQEVARSKTG